MKPHTRSSHTSSGPNAMRAKEKPDRAGSKMRVNVGLDSRESDNGEYRENMGLVHGAG